MPNLGGKPTGPGELPIIGHDCRDAGHKLSSFRLEMGKVVVIVVSVGEMRAPADLFRQPGPQQSTRLQTRLAGNGKPRAIFAAGATVVAQHEMPSRSGSGLCAPVKQAFSARFGQGAKLSSYRPQGPTRCLTLLSGGDSRLSWPEQGAEAAGVQPVFARSPAARICSTVIEVVSMCRSSLSSITAGLPEAAARSKAWANSACVSTTSPWPP